MTPETTGKIRPELPGPHIRHSCAPSLKTELSKTPGFIRSERFSSMGICLFPGRQTRPGLVWIMRGKMDLTEELTVRLKERGAALVGADDRSRQDMDEP